MVYEIGSVVNDVAWAPYSSSVFAALTGESEVLVYDININRLEPICRQRIVSPKKAKLTHLVFSSFYPIILVGDNK